jgi:hypothetical protein
MASKIPIDLNQPANTLSAIADKIRKDLVVKNDYQLSKNEYGVTNPDAISDGDGKGRGTGVFLDIQNGGTSTDQVAKVDNIKLNKYSSKNPYNTPSTE